jgi:putative endonuclease
MNKWWVYIVACSDETLYTGCTNDLEKRLVRHNAGTGAKYTRSRLPVKMVFYESQTTQSEALKREREIKKKKRYEKIQLIQEFQGNY